MRLKNTAEFIDNVKQIYGDKYNCSKAHYINSHTKVCIICPEHGEFWITPTNLLSGKGCKKCAVESRNSTANKFKLFESKAKNKYHNFYIYHQDDYIDCKTPTLITCPIHGDFKVTPDKHLNGNQGCPLCKQKKEIKEKVDHRAVRKNNFVAKGNTVHNGKYDYSETFYENGLAKVCIICPEHGEFWQTPQAHLSGQGCPVCARKSHLKTTNEFIEKAKEIHGDKNDYSKTDYINSRTKVCITCKIHGDFWQTPNNHLNGKGCPYCAGKYKTTETIINEFKNVHGDKYIYDSVEYNGATNKVCIICPEHGEFWQTPNKHLQGRGCPLCNQSHLEERLYNWLTSNKINFLKGHRPKWLHGKELDFYLLDYNIAIECQGEQHFPTFNHVIKQGYRITIEEMKATVKRDIAKNKECKEHGVKLFYVIAYRIPQKEIIENQDYCMIYLNDNIINDMDAFKKEIFDSRIANNVE